GTADPAGGRQHRLVSETSRRIDVSRRALCHVRYRRCDRDGRHGARAGGLGGQAYAHALSRRAGAIVAARRAVLRFYTVGAAGIVVQLAALTFLKSGLHLDYLPATATAVEAALLHNFFWHERWT